LSKVGILDVVPRMFSEHVPYVTVQPMFYPKWSKDVQL